MQIAVFQLKPAVFLYILCFFELNARFRNGSAVPQFFAPSPLLGIVVFFLCIVKKKRAFKHVKRSAFQIPLGIKKAAFPPLCAFAVTRNAPILLFIYLFNFNIRKPLSFRNSPGLSRFIPVYPVQYPFMTCILPLHSGGSFSPFMIPQTPRSCQRSLRCMRTSAHFHSARDAAGKARERARIPFAIYVASMMLRYTKKG